MADFRIRIIVDPTAAVKGAKRVERSLGRIENRANSLRRSLGLTFAALAGGAIIFSAIRSMAKFEESIATARAVTKATGDEFVKLRDKAQDLGITTRFSATQAADALVLLARAGFSVEESLTAVGSTLDLALAGGVGLAEAADITATALRGFRLEAEETARVTDVLTETANSANTTVSQLGQALKFVAPIAKGLNQSIEATSAALGVLSDAGLKATLAGTGLRGVLAKLESPSTELAKLLREAGLAADKVAPSTNKLADVLDRLKAAGIGTGESFKIFGLRAGPAFQVLVSNIPKVRELTEALKNSGGEAKRVGDIINDTLNGALIRAKSALEGFVIALGQVGVSDFLIGTLDGIAGAFRFLARNALLLQTALVALATAGVAKLAAVLGAALVPALRQVVLALAIARGGALAAALSFTTLTLAIQINPFVFLATSIAAVFFAIKELDLGFKAIGETLNQIEEDAKRVPPAFAQIGRATRELNNINRLLTTGVSGPSGEILKQDKLSEAQLKRKRELQAELGTLTKAIEKQASAQAEANDREKRGADITDNLIQKLERRLKLVSALTVKDQERVKFQEELFKLEEKNAVPNAKEKERIRTLLESITAQERQQRIFESIKGPQSEFIKNTAATTALLKEGAITAGEFAVKMQELKDALAPTDVADRQLNALDLLKQENDALILRARLGKEGAAVEEILNQLREDKIKITEDLRAQTVAEVQLNSKFTKGLQDRIDKENELVRIAQQEERQLDRLERRLRSEEALNKERARAIELFNQNRLSADGLARALEDVQLKGLEASNALEDGFTRAFIKIKQEAEDLAAVGESVVNVFADNLTNALSKLAEDGKLSFKDLANSILQDLARILARALVVQLITAALGGGGGISSAQFVAGIVGGKQKGGTVQPARSFVVGENGPELFVPDRTGTIVPNAKDQSAAAPVVNVQVVNVSSPDEVPAAINDGIADEAIINSIARNKDRVNAAQS